MGGRGAGRAIEGLCVKHLGKWTKCSKGDEVSAWPKAAHNSRLSFIVGKCLRLHFSPAAAPWAPVRLNTAILWMTGLRLALPGDRAHTMISSLELFVASADFSPKQNRTITDFFSQCFQTQDPFREPGWVNERLRGYEALRSATFLQTHLMPSASKGSIWKIFKKVFLKGQCLNEFGLYVTSSWGFKWSEPFICKFRSSPKKPKIYSEINWPARKHIRKKIITEKRFSCSPLTRARAVSWGDEKEVLGPGFLSSHIPALEAHNVYKMAFIDDTNVYGLFSITDYLSYWLLRKQGKCHWCPLHTFLGK